MRVDLKPMSVNCAWRGGRRFKTKDHLAYERELLWLLKGQPEVKGFYEMEIIFHIKTYLRSDISNLIKVTEDIIVKSGIVEDDSKCLKLVLSKFKSDTDWFEFTITPVKSQTLD